MRRGGEQRDPERELDERRDGFMVVPRLGEGRVTDHEREEAEDRLTHEKAGGEHDPVDPGTRALEHGHGRPERERTRRGDERVQDHAEGGLDHEAVTRPAQIALARFDVSGSTPASARAARTASATSVNVGP